jgi:hypothetical protein
MDSEIKASKLIFSGHESFQCRQLWLKKGYDFMRRNKSFNDEDAVVELGVGKNMVDSIRFWMRAFNLLTTSDELTDFAIRLFSDDGYDPYIEDEGTLWLLHYQLVKKGYSSSYSIIFNELRREKIEFNKDNFISYVKRKIEINHHLPVSEKTLKEDFSVFSKMYLQSDSQSKDREDNFSGLLTELNLIKSIYKNKEEYFIIENSERTEIPDEILLYAILDNEKFELSVNLSTLEQNYNSVGSVFAINRPGLLSKIENITSKFPEIIFNDNAGIKELQFKRKPNLNSILDLYYAN